MKTSIRFQAAYAVSALLLPHVAASGQELPIPPFRADEITILQPKGPIRYRKIAKTGYRANNVIQSEITLNREAPESSIKRILVHVLAEMADEKRYAHFAVTKVSCFYLHVGVGSVVGGSPAGRGCRFLGQMLAGGESAARQGGGIDPVYYRTADVLQERYTLDGLDQSIASCPD